MIVETLTITDFIKFLPIHLVEAKPNTMDRIDRQELFMRMAQLMSLRGNCGRAKVGCIITSHDYRLISSGYNGPLGAHSCSGECDITQSCKVSIHAEANAIAAAAKFGVKLAGGILFCTHAPCPNCAGLIIQSGIIEVNYQVAYHDESGVELLSKNKVEVNHLPFIYE